MGQLFPRAAVAQVFLVLPFKLIAVNVIIAFKRAGRNRVFLQAILLKKTRILWNVAFPRL